MAAGRQISQELADTIVKLKKRYDDERSAGPMVPTKDPAGRTAAGLGVGIATVKRVMARHVKGELIFPAQRPGRPPSELPQRFQSEIRAFVRSQNLIGRKVSIECLRRHLRDHHDIDVPKTTLWRALGRWGFTYGVGRRRDSLKEQDYVIRARREYLRIKLANRGSNGEPVRPEIYLDETYINRNHSRKTTWYEEMDGAWVNKPSGVGERLIIVNAITRGGWIDGAQLVFQAKRRTGDYHGQMNWLNFSKWFTEKLLPNVPEGAIIILDNAKYHNVLVEDFFPSLSSTKEQMQSWLTRNRISWLPDMLKCELLELCKRHAPEPEYRLDHIAAQKNVTILRTPPYHPELQPIETCWAVVKNHMADNCDFTMKGLKEKLPDAFDKVTSRTCKRIMDKIVEIENKYWQEDVELDELYTKDAREELQASVGSSNEAVDPYLGESEELD